ncbi:hypothetical protein PHLGIDRAFT_332670 [Phlebiopsis gigantea 11061_1 CR5-6]|uniref:Uncharacterized protein n=1 Tax=Phlebiopsis gigantea (strain 11061_1 CR5-6) TaxID=745531 RepID=A0A0C3P3A1_PHLG1|nr:hypothetical protein PHLGIDRAFT_332670 [Phlebiopsis gigantea 11061_1 CR5-6]
MPVLHVGTSCACNPKRRSKRAPAALLPAATAARQARAPDPPSNAPSSCTQGPPTPPPRARPSTPHHPHTGCALRRSAQPWTPPARRIQSPTHTDTARQRLEDEPLVRAPAGSALPLPWWRHEGVWARSAPAGRRDRRREGWTARGARWVSTAGHTA